MSCKRMIRTALRKCLYDASQDSAKRYHGLRSQTVSTLKSVPAAFWLCDLRKDTKLF